MFYSILLVCMVVYSDTEDQVSCTFALFIYNVW